MLDRILRRAPLLGLSACLLLAACNTMAKLPKLPGFNKAKPPAIAPAADPAVAAATKYSVTIVETDLDRRGTIASGSITLNAPLAQATAGTYSLSPSPSNGILPAGKDVATTLQSNRSGKIEITHSGTLSILKFLAKDGDAIFKIMGPPHGNAIKDHWFYRGGDCGIATVTPRS